MRYAIGVDEAGRGPLAGPVAVGVVMVEESLLPELRALFPGVNDSKKLSEGKREEIYALMEEKAEGRAGEAGAPAIRFCVRFASAEAIDADGIVPSIYGCVSSGISALAPLDASGLAGGKAEEGASYRILLDGALRAPSSYEQETVIRGDSIHPIISLASIAAKVERDRLMKTLAEQFPAYAFERHKGYGTALHYEMLEKHGPCVLHRRSFLPVEMRAAEE